MKTKAVFLDVDGTLVNDRGLVPESAQRAVRDARANGHLVFLCTGRSPAELWPAIREIGFDGLIAGSGAFVEVGGHVLVHRGLTRQEVGHVLDFFGSHHVDIYLQANDGIYATDEVRARLRQLIRGSVTDQEVLAELEGGLFGFIDAITVDADPYATVITKVIYLFSDVTLDELRAEFTGSFVVIPSSVPLFGPTSGELMLRGVNKATGIDVLLDHVGVDRADTIAIGDSYNDLEMLEHVAVGVAMGDAPDPVKDIADEVTAGVDEDGIRLSFLRHGLIAG
ncbi:MAG TPA: Cof-type HAD-IIB family hydrolase [Propionicimonas sp.]|uniref:Cof-type HAD-IIB family hydrolase n=1 Tax=Propionicimonas sp. TaxID=1955623 RepID=UPI002F3EE18A